MNATKELKGSKYKFRDVLSATGATHSQIMWWVKQGWLGLSKGGDRESRPKREYTYDSLVRIALMKALMDAGIPAIFASVSINLARHLLLRMKPPVDIFSPDSRHVIENRTCLIHLVNMEREVYVSIEPKGRGKGAIEFSEQLSLAGLRVARNIIAHDSYNVPPGLPYKEHDGDDVIWFKTVLNLGSVLKGVFALTPIGE